MKNSSRMVITCSALAICTAAANAADMPVKGPVPSAAPIATGPSWELFGGVAVAPDSVFGDVGAVYAFNRNLNTDGWLFRLRGGFGNYDYNRAPGLSQSVDFQTGEFMFGYQTFIGSTRLSGYVGPNVEHHANPDPNATVTGTEWGVRGQAEIFTQFNGGYALLLATGSSAFSSYFVLGKVGFNVTPNISVGPELAFLGNDRFDFARLGPFVGFDLGQGAQLILSGGYQWDNRADALNDHSGGYFTAHARKTF